MNTGKKILISAGWLVGFLAICLLVQELRQVGTTWTNEAGFLRVLALLLLSASTLAPLVMAVLVWFGRPKNLYQKRP